MKAKFKKKPGYTAPKMEAASFKAEQGYATSATPPTSTVSIVVDAAGL